LSWIGSLSSYARDTYLMILNANHPVKTVDELRTTSVKTRLGAGRSGSANLIYALLAKDLLKINVDIVRGYEGTVPIFLAQQRGEVDGVFADLSTIEVAAAAQWKDKQVVPVVNSDEKPVLPKCRTSQQHESLSKIRRTSLSSISRSCRFTLPCLWLVRAGCRSTAKRRSWTASWRWRQTQSFSRMPRSSIKMSAK
jgi:hypothetical protein